MNNVFIAYDHMLFLQDVKNTNNHKHMMKHVTICMDGYMKCKLGKEDVDTYGYILKEKVSHERYGETNESDKMVFLIEPSSGLSKEIDKILGENDYMLLNKSQVNAIVETWKDKMCNKLSIDNYNEAINHIFMLCGLKRNSKVILDNRISLAIDIINEKDILSSTLIENITNKIHLSRSRFLHLFKENVGISFKDFILTKKFINTWIYLAQGESITESCIHGGFFDSAHYTHFMSQCFGLVTRDELKSINSIYLVNKF